MSYPNYGQQGYGPPAPPQPGPYGQPQNPGYLPAQPAYAPPPQGYGYSGQQPAPQQAPLPQVPREQLSLEGWMNQPRGGKLAPDAKKALPAPGYRIILRVERDLQDGPPDVDVQRDFSTKAPILWRDGRPRLQLQIPCLVQSPVFPEGKCTLYAKNQMAEALATGQIAAGIQPGAPRAGAVIDITRDMDQPGANGMSPKHMFRITYTPAPSEVQDGNGQPQAAPQMQDMATAQAPQQQQAAPEWPNPGAPLSVPPSPAPPGTNPYNNPALPPNQPDVPTPSPPVAPSPTGQASGSYAPPPPSNPQAPPPPQPYGMAPPGQQVAAATQAATQAARQHLPPQPPAAPPQVPQIPGLDAEAQQIMAGLINQASPQQ